MLLSIQNTQSNGLMAGLTVLGFALAERRNYLLSTLCIVFSFYIKIYGALAFIFYLWYPGKWKLAAGRLAGCCCSPLLPLLVVSGHQLALPVPELAAFVVERPLASIGLSVMGLLETWFHLATAQKYRNGGGPACCSWLPLLRWRLYPGPDLSVVVSGLDVDLDGDLQPQGRVADLYHRHGGYRDLVFLAATRSGWTGYC